MDKKLIYISDFPLDSKSGHGNMIRMHFKILQSIFQENMYSFVIEGDEKVDGSDHNYYYPVNSNKGKVLAVLKGYPAYLSSKMEQDILSKIRNNDFSYVFIENSISGNLLKKIKKQNPKIKIISYFPDIEADLMRQQLKQSKPYRRVSLKMMIHNEKITAEYADKQIILNDRDEVLYEKYYGKKPTDKIPCIVEDNSRQVEQKKHDKTTVLDLLFVGVDYYPNVYGIDWFINSVCPLIDSDFKLKIVGFNMEKYKQRWEAKDKRVEVVGSVDSIKPYYERCDAVIAPIFEGGGMKVKTAEALSYGKPVIGTTESTFGYWKAAESLQGKWLYKNDIPETFASTIKELQNRTFCTPNEEVSAFFNKEYSVDANKEKMMKIINA